MFLFSKRKVSWLYDLIFDTSRQSHAGVGEGGTRVGRDVAFYPDADEVPVCEGGDDVVRRKSCSWFVAERLAS